MIDAAFTVNEMAADEVIKMCLPSIQSCYFIASYGGNLWLRKSTLANLIMGFWEPQKGKIQINGVDTKNISKKQLNLLTSIVQQEVFLFNMSMEENIRARKPTATMEEIIAAAKRARIVLTFTLLPSCCLGSSQKGRSTG